MWWRPTTRNASRLAVPLVPCQCCRSILILSHHRYWIKQKQKEFHQIKILWMQSFKIYSFSFDKVIMTHLWTPRPKYMRENIPNICAICEKKNLNFMQSFPVPVPHSSCQSFTVVVMLSEHIQQARLHPDVAWLTYRMARR